MREGGSREGVRVVVYEADERVGRSILATGNGRCNFSNAQLSLGGFRNGEYVAISAMVLEGLLEDMSIRCARGSNRAFGEAVRGFFASMGLVWREEGEGRLYPYANKASSVLDVLRGTCSALGVEERCGLAVESVDPPSFGASAAPRDKGSRFTLKMADGSFERADAVVVACGGRVARGLLPRSFAFAELRPVLGPLATENRVSRQLDNIRVRGVASLVREGGCVMQEEGEVLFRKYGLSGIAVFNLSREALPGDTIFVDMLPFLRDCDVESFAFGRFKTLARTYGSGMTCGAYLRGLVLPQVARVVLKEIGLDEDDPCPKKAAPAIVSAFKALSFRVEGIADEKQCQVHRGGFDLKAFSPYTMEALEVPGLFAAGEMLDVDALCGGYNLHWAWTSGAIAGYSAATRLLGGDVRSFPAPSFAYDHEGEDA